MDNIVELTEVSKKIRRTEVLQDISLSVPHSICGVIGQNGAGKSMLLKLICGLIRASSGCVSVFGESVGKSGRVAQHTGILIEHPGIIGDYSAYDNLRSLLRQPRKKVAAEIITVLNEVGLDPDDKTPVKKYSLGAKQKLGIAEAFLNNPQLMLLDEPSINLDEDSRQRLYGLIRTKYEKGATIVIASHEKQDIDELCNMIVHLENGRVIEVTRREGE